MCINMLGTAANCRLSFNNCDRYSGFSVSAGSVWVAGGDVLQKSKDKIRLESIKMSVSLSMTQLAAYLWEETDSLDHESG